MMIGPRNGRRRHLDLLARLIDPAIRLCWLALCGVLAVLVSGCVADKAKFNYGAPWTDREGKPLQWKRAEVYVVDERQDRGIDEALEGGTKKAVAGAMVIELNALALVDDAVAVDAYYGERDSSREAYLQRGVDIEVVTTLRELRWEIENQGLKSGLAAGAVAGATVAAGVLGGLVATVAVASTDTDVDGYAKVEIRWREVRFDRSFQKIYTGHCEREIPTLDADENPAKSLIAACALALAMEEFRKDVRVFAAGGTVAPPTPVPAPAS